MWGVGGCETGGLAGHAHVALEDIGSWGCEADGKGEGRISWSAGRKGEVSRDLSAEGKDWSSDGDCWHVDPSDEGGFEN